MKKPQLIDAPTTGPDTNDRSGSNTTGGPISPNAQSSRAVLGEADRISDIVANSQLTLLRLTVNVSDPQNLDMQLSHAVNQLIPAALERRHGILVTQFGWGKYAVEVDSEVPCGSIHEKRS